MKYIKVFEKWTDTKSLENYSNFVQMHFVKMSGLIKLCHWHVKDYNKHLAWDELYNIFAGKMDSLIEAIMGSNLLTPNASLLQYEAFRNYELTDVDLVISDHNEFLRNLILFLESLKEDKTISNTIDEMISEINEVAYKLSLE